MPEFLKLIPPDAGLAILLEAIPLNLEGVDNISVENALGRITSIDIHSPEDLPAFARSTVDGYAVHAQDTFGTSESLPGYLKVIGEVPMGSVPDFSVAANQAALIFTGGMLPDGANAVVMIENTQVSIPGEIEVLKPVGISENVLKQGEDVLKDQIIFSAGHKLRPADIAGLLAVGITNVDVFRRPKIGVLSSGDEVIPPENKPDPGQVRDINSAALGCLISENGANAVQFGIVPDEAEKLSLRLKDALDNCDAVVITAGSSASTRDYTSDAIQANGSPGVLVHGVNVKPGKPTILAVCRGKPVIGLPGNPVSAMVIANLFLIPVIEKLSGVRSKNIKSYINANLSINIPSQAGREDWIPVRLERMEDGWTAIPVFYKSNLIFSLSRADGLIKIEPNATGLAAGELVEVRII